MGLHTHNGIIINRHISPTYPHNGIINGDDSTSIETRL